MSEALVIAIIISIGIICGIGFVFLRIKENYKRTLSLTFLQVTLPKKESDSDERKETQKDFKEMISIMEQLYSSLKSLYSKKILKKILWQDTISFEYVAHEWEIRFFIVVPKHYKHLIEKQVNGFYADAIIEETTEINIFKGRSKYAATYINTAKEYFFPIKTYQKLESDPINNITNAFSKLEEDESAVIQVLLQPIDDDWQSKCIKASRQIMQWKKTYFSLNPFKILLGIFELFTSSSDDNNQNPQDDHSSALTQERAKTVDEKWDKSGFTAIVRIIATGNSQHMVDTELVNITSAFSQFSYPEFNKFTTTLRHSEKKLIHNYIYRYFKKPMYLKKMILNTEELASIFHFPHIRYNQTPEIKWQNFKITKAPNNIPKEWMLLGHNVHRWVKKEIRIKNEDRFRHFYVIGQTGTGKSSIMQVMARQDLANGNGLCIMDPHGDLAKDLLPFIPRERADDVIIFDPSDTDRPLGLNLLEAKNPEDHDMVALNAMNIMIKLFWSEIFGPRIQDYFRNGVMTLMAHPEWWALTDIVRLFTNDDFRRERVNKLKNPIVKGWWDSTYAKMWEREKWEIIPYFAAKFGGFITNEMMRNIIGQLDSSFDILDIMQNKKILMVNLSKWSIGDLNSELLGMILVSKIQMAAMGRDKIPKEDRTDFFLYIDEFQNYVTDSIESILSEARKYRLGLTIAHQYLGQLEKSDALTKSNTNLKDAIFGNVWSIMSYKIWPQDGEFMEKYYAPVFWNQDLVNMDKFKAVMKLSVDNQPTVPFSVIPQNPYLETGDPKLADAFKELSRLKHGRDKAFIGKEIEYRIGSM